LGRGKGMMEQWNSGKLASSNVGIMAGSVVIIIRLFQYSTVPISNP
jgi:hypothetical protein